jgi:hypothetical protein
LADAADCVGDAVALDESEPCMEGAGADWLRVAEIGDASIALTSQG